MNSQLELMLSLVVSLANLKLLRTKHWVTLSSEPNSLEFEKTAALVTKKVMNLLLVALLPAHSHPYGLSIHIDFECRTHEASYNTEGIFIDILPAMQIACISKDIEQVEATLTKDIGDILSDLANAHFNGADVGGDSRYEIRRRD